MEGQPKVSVIIPVYNAERYLRECLDSVTNQTLKEIEIICVDDGSTDKSIDIIKEYKETDGRFVLLQQKRRFAGTARNAGMSVASGKYYVFLDADDFFELDLLEKEYNLCETYEAEICLCGADKYNIRTNQFQEAPWLLNLEHIKNQPFSRFDVDNIFEVTAANPWTKMFSSKFVNDKGLKFQGLKRANDVFFVLTALALAEKIVATDKVLVHYRVGQTNNLQANKKETSTLFCDALLAVKEKLEKENIYHSVEQSYLNMVVNQIQYNISSLISEGAGSEELVVQVKNKYWDLLGLSSLIPGKLNEPKKFEYVMKALAKVKPLPNWTKDFNSSSSLTHTPMISILIPIYNTSAYLERCLDSAIRQTLEDIEIICVNDGSTDNSAQLLSRYADQDNRVRIITQENSGLFMARKVAVEHSLGKYIMFLDSDDWLETNACQELYNEMRLRQADIIQFGTYIETDKWAQEQRIAGLERILQPYPQWSYSVFQDCFLKQQFGFTIWNKIYRADIVKRAYAQLPTDKIFKAEDLYAFFVIAFYSQSYFGIENKYYHYRFGAGLTGRSSIEMPAFLAICKQRLVVTRIKEFLCNTQVWDKYENVYNLIYSNLLNEVLNNWANYLNPVYCREGIAEILKYWDKRETVVLLAKKYRYQSWKLADIIQDASTFPILTIKEGIRKIGIYYPRFSIGGVQRVISLLIPLYREMGYDVVFFCDEKEVKEGFTLADNIELICIPQFSDPEIRIRELYTQLEEKKIDLFIHHATSQESLLFDMLAAKVQGIPVVITLHEAFTAQISRLGIGAARKHEIYRIADLVLVLSRVQESYWKALGVRSRFILNPMTCTYDPDYKPNLSSHTIIWVGRIADDKNCDDAIRILARVKKVIPDVKLIIVGDAADRKKKEVIDGLIGYYRVHDSVERVGFTKEIDQYYREASVYLMTSQVESFSMALAESKFYGIPAVMFDIPIIDLAHPETGTITVPWKNCERAAEEIIRLFLDKNYMEQKSRLARDCAKKLSMYDIKAAWDSVFHAFEEVQKNSSEEDTNVRISIESIYSQYVLACNRYNELKMELGKVSKEKEKLDKKLRNQNKSISWRVGRFITYIPRKIRGGIRCYKQHGMRYTLDRIKYKIRKRMGKIPLITKLF